MKVEIVEFYEQPPIEKKSKCIGTLHVYLIDYDIDLRGVRVFEGKNRMNFFMPRKETIDPETKEKVFYPIFNFTKKEKNGELMREIQKQATKFIKEKKKQAKKK